MGVDFIQFSLTPILIGVLASVACALPGNFLILRQQALLGDAVSHVVFPGIVMGFLVSGTVSATPMVMGAISAAIIAVVCIEIIKRFGRIAPGAAMGITFSSLFASGVIALEQSDTTTVHLDVEHALMGNLESLIWYEANGWHSLIEPASLAQLPHELNRLALVCIIILVLLFIFWRPLKISTFDEYFARTTGLPTITISLCLTMISTISAVTAFDAVGCIIVIAMFICPPATARLITNRLYFQVWWSVGFASLSAVLGYILAGYGPLWLGVENSVSAAGMIATISGFILGLACLFGQYRARTNCS